MDLYNEVMSLQKQLEYSIKQLRVNGTAYADAEREYKIAVNKKAVELDEQGKKVTLIQLTIYGYEDIANLRKKRDYAKIIYEANIEAINSLKLRLRLLDNQISREFSSGGN